MYIDIYSLEEKDIFNCTVIEEKLISISNYPLHSRDLVANVVRFKEKKERKRRKRGKSYTLVKISRLLSKSLSPAHRSIHDQRNFVLINPTQFQPETAGWRKIFRQIIRPAVRLWIQNGGGRE